MVLVLTVGVLVIGASLAFIWVLCSRAPLGYEDQAGFHQIGESELAAKKMKHASTPPLKAHNDHEPIAA